MDAGTAAFRVVDILCLCAGALHALKASRSTLPVGILALVGRLVSTIAFGFFSIVSTLHSLPKFAPADKATVLSNGISEAMNCAALGFILMLPIGVLLFIGEWRRSHGSRRAL